MVYYTQDLLKQTFDVRLMTKCCEVFLGFPIRDVRDSNEMTGPGSVQLYSWHVYSTAACCTVYSRATSTLTSAASRAPESGRAGELSRVQCGAGHEIIWNKSFTIKILRFAANASEWRPEILKLSETNHLQLIFTINFAANMALKFWNIMKK